jgi:hypothetical protein
MFDNGYECIIMDINSKDTPYSIMNSVLQVSLSHETTSLEKSMLDNSNYGGLVTCINSPYLIRSSKRMSVSKKGKTPEDVFKYRNNIRYECDVSFFFQ